MPRINGGEMLVRALEREGVHEIVTLHGGHLDAGCAGPTASRAGTGATAADARKPIEFFCGQKRRTAANGAWLSRRDI
jgi:hypothetical protein